ncbi:MAG: hypothetical protein HRF45_05320 [Fimbriimonadia bacterium]|jgi:hypothetical protein
MKSPDAAAAIERLRALTLEIEQAWASGDHPLVGQLVRERERVLRELEQCPPSPEHLETLRRAGSLDTRLLRVLEAEIEAVKSRLTTVHRSKQAHAAYSGGHKFAPRLIEREG